MIFLSLLLHLVVFFSYKLSDINIVSGKASKNGWQNKCRKCQVQQETRCEEPGATWEDVWITDARVQGTVLSTRNTTRSYVVRVPQGTLRRNRHHLVPLQTNSGVVDVDDPPMGGNALVTTSEPGQPATTSLTTETVRTRSGREVRKPKRLDLWLADEKWIKPTDACHVFYLKGVNGKGVSGDLEVSRVACLPCCSVLVERSSDVSERLMSAL